MSDLRASLMGESLIIERGTALTSGYEVERIPLDGIQAETRYRSTVAAADEARHHLVLLQESLPQGMLVVALFLRTVEYWLHTDPERHPLQSLISVRKRVLAIRLTKRRLSVTLIGFALNPFRIPIEEQMVTVGGAHSRHVVLPMFEQEPGLLQRLRLRASHHSWRLDELLEGEPPINSLLQYRLRIAGQGVHYSIQKRRRGGPKYYFVPMRRVRASEHVVHVRRNSQGTLVLVRRPLERAEMRPFVRAMEHWIVSAPFKILGRVYRGLGFKPINLYFEKFAAGVEEGAFDVFRRMNVIGTTRNYFVIDPESDAFPAIRDVPGVVRKFSVKAYWLMYAATSVIATESAAHLHVLRSNDAALRRSLIGKRFVFLQHGVTYLKPQGRHSPFGKDKEFHPSLAVVSGEKEARVVGKYFDLRSDQVIAAGLPIFDRLRWQHITQPSKDIALIMLTWKPYEEHLADFAQSSYYRHTIEAFEALRRVLPREDIRIVGHPRIASLLEGTDLEPLLWSGTIAEALESTKLLLTDYSSVAYNAFYQGGAVIFYQPDLDYYERYNGRLIPSDDEYVGRRVFTPSELDRILKTATRDGTIQLRELRTRKHVANYSRINEFRDGRNIERIFDELTRRGII